MRNPFAVGIAMFLLTGVCSVLAGFWLRHVGHRGSVRPASGPGTTAEATVALVIASPSLQG